MSMYSPRRRRSFYGGGFPRNPSHTGIKAAQRAIFRTQIELEWLAVQSGNRAVILCDRGALDGLAYWPDDEASFWRELGCSREARLAEYEAVIHLKAPFVEMGYNHQNPVRTGTAEEARRLGTRMDKPGVATPDSFTSIAKIIFSIKPAR